MLNQIVLSIVVLLVALERYGDAAATNTAANILSLGFQAETHHVTTSDGYILEMYRIPYARFQTTTTGSGPRPVVFLMHGMFSAAEVYTRIGPDLSMAYNMADVGFDVWMGNHRGTKPSRRHLTLDPDNSSSKMQFFDFSWDEVGSIDTPAMIDYVLNYTGRDHLHYVGHSQGGTSFLVMASIRTEYNEKIASAHLLAGVGNMNYFPDTALTATAQLTDTLYATAGLLRIREMFPPNSSSIIGRRSDGISRLDTCLGDIKYKDLCESIGVRHYMRENGDDNYDSSNDFIGGGSLKQLAHYGQNIRDKVFQRWNYGSTQNLVQYGTPTPPAYNLSLITINTTMHYSLNDSLLDEQDVLDMAAVMPNTVARKVARDSFDHMDYVDGADAKELVTDNVIESILYMESILMNSDSDQDDVDEIEQPVESPSVETAPTDSAISSAYSSIMLVFVLSFTLSTYLI